MSDPALNKAVVRRYLAAIGHCDKDAARELVAPGFTHSLMGTAMAGTYGLDDIFEKVGALASVVQGINLEVVGQVAEGEFVATRASGDMTTIDGQPYRNHYVFWAELAKGRLARFYEYMDSQLGNDVLGPLFRARAAQ